MEGTTRWQPLVGAPQAWLEPGRPTTPLVRAAAQTLGPAPRCALGDDGADASKALWLFELGSTDGERLAAAQRMTRLIEILHGKEGHTANAQRVARRLFAEPDVRARVLAEAEPLSLSEGSERVELALSLLNLGETKTPTAFFFVEGKPSDEMLATFAARAGRAAELCATLAIVPPEVCALLRDGHINSPRPRPLLAQIVDMSDRIAGMLAPRPQRPGMPAQKVAAILSSAAIVPLFDDVVLAAMGQALLTGDGATLLEG